MTTKPRTLQDNGNSKTSPEVGEEELDAEGGAIGGGLPENKAGGTMLQRALSPMQYLMVRTPETVESWSQTCPAFLLYPQQRGAPRQRNNQILELRLRELQPSLASWHEDNRGRQHRACPISNCTTASRQVTSKTCHSTTDSTTAPFQVTVEKGSLQWRLVLHMFLSTSEKGSHPRRLVL